MKVNEIEEFARGEAMKDPEFSREVRYFTGSLKISIDEDHFALHFLDGSLDTVNTEVLADEASEIVIRGTQEHWDEMLKEYPVPFYQCLQTTSVRHGLYMNNSDSCYAYLPALNRLTALLRQVNIKERTL
jgi:hypothetical protein